MQLAMIGLTAIWSCGSDFQHNRPRQLIKFELSGISCHCLLPAALVFSASASETRQHLTTMSRVLVQKKFRIVVLYMYLIIENVIYLLTVDRFVSGPSNALRR
jgi:hypothetical protein